MGNYPVTQFFYKTFCMHREKLTVSSGQCLRKNGQLAVGTV